MGAARSAASIVRHAGGALTEAILIAAILGLIALALSPAYGPARFLTGSDEAAAAKVVGRITVQEPVAHGETTIATVNPGGANVYVFVQCYNPDYVFAAYYPVGADNQAVLGPLWATTWKSGGGDCTAKEGYFRRDGWGKWVTVAQTSFTVTP